MFFLCCASLRVRISQAGAARRQLHVSFQDRVLKRRVEGAVEAMARGVLPARKRPAATCQKRSCASKTPVQKKPAAQKEQPVRVAETEKNGTVTVAEKEKNGTADNSTAEKADFKPVQQPEASPRKPSREAELLSPQGMLDEWDSYSDRAKLEILADCARKATLTPEWVREG